MNALILAFITATNTFNLPQGLLPALCYAESKHNVQARHIDDGGEDSIGVCQLHLSTARWLGYKGDEKGLFNPKVNAYYAAKYLKKQLNRYDGDVFKAVAAYNTGTYYGSKTNRQYVKKVVTYWTEAK